MYLKIRLLSDTAFGRGDGVVGVVDNEIEHDSTTGLPVVKGRTIKGLVVEACANILYGLALNPATRNAALPFFEDVALELFGQPGSKLVDNGILHFHTATLPEALVKRVRRSRYKMHEVLEAFTDIRRQTAVDPERDTPMDQTLRATRVVLRDTIFHAPITTNDALDEAHLALLAACVNTVRHAGLNRTRGLGHIHMTLEETDAPVDVAQFERLVRERAG